METAQIAFERLVRLLEIVAVAGGLLATADEPASARQRAELAVDIQLLREHIEAYRRYARVVAGEDR